MAAQLTLFLAQARAAADATFGAWGLTATAVRIADGGSATGFLLELLGADGFVTGFLEVTGSGFVAGNAQAGNVTSITQLDINGTPVPGNTANFAGLSLNTLSYGLVLTSAALAADLGAVHVPLTQGANTVTGSSAFVFLDGGAGNDALVGGLTGSYGVSYDSLVGGIGVKVSLALTTAQVTGGGGTDTLTRITNLEGSQFNDTLTGSTVANIIYGNDGNDDLFGGLGNDTLFGGAGINALDGGAGADTFDGTDGVGLASYASSATAVGISLGGVRVGADAIGDVFVNISGLIGSRFADTLTGDGADNVIEGGAGADVLDGGLQGAFGDIVSYARAARAVRVDLSFQGVAQPSSSVGDAAGDRLTGFENVEGSAFNDTLIGDAGANRLFGGRGNDLLQGGAGADTLDGGEGIDTATYAASLDGVFVDLIGVPLGGDADGDQLFGIENLIGSAFDDTLYGFSISNVLDGGAGDDLIDGDTGNDTLIGGTNSSDGDTVSYGFATSGVTVSLALTTAQNTGGSGIDVISGFENLEGSNFGDVLTGTTTRNILSGFAGNDRIFGGGGNDVLNGDDGDDTLEGGAGFDDLFGGEVDEVVGDTVSYAASAAGVTIDLGLQGTGQFQTSAGDASLDFLDGFENIRGSRFADTLTGDDRDNIIEGGAGADSLVGGLDGDHGDTASYANAAAAVRVNLAQVVQAAAGAGDASGDRLVGIENVLGSAFNDVLTGDAGDNWLSGGAGNDTLHGGGGAMDTLDGGAGAGDVADFTGVVADIDVNLLNGSVTGGGLSNTMLIEIEGAIGGSGNDTLTASAGGGILSGGLGDDSIVASNFNDTLDGGANSLLGRDTLSYDRAGAGVVVNLSLTTAQNTIGSGVDLIRGFEKLEGSNFADTLTGDAGNNEIQGRSGNNLLSGLAGNDDLVGGQDNDTLIGGVGADTLNGSGNGAAGDTASYATSAAAVNVSLIGGVVGLGGDAAGDVLFGIENLIGSRLADTLTGDANDNVIEGGAGADRLFGGGNTGVGDTVSYAASTVGVNIGLTGAVGIGGDAAGDVLDGFENMTGSAFNDTLAGTTGANVLRGGAGNDRLIGLGGGDVLDGGAGLGDTADYTGVGSSNSLTINLISEETTGFANGLTDTLIGIENATGGAGVDNIVGNNLANVLNGGDGDDFIIGGLGNDTLIGGAGFDIVAFDGAGGVSASLSITTAQNFGVFYGTDLISGFEGITGSEFNDSLTGNASDNFLNGIGGDDTLTGLAGADRLYGGAGNDLLFGGLGADLLDGGAEIDTVSYVASAAGVSVGLFFGAPASSGGDAAGDELFGIENLIGSRFVDVLFGDANDNIIEGGAGADSLSGGGNLTGVEAGDTVSYAGSTVAVTVDLQLQGTQPATATAQVSGGDAAGDRLSGFEKIVGSAFNDTLTGDASVNTLFGGRGNDVLRAIGDGDRLYGGDGSDTVTFAGETAGVDVFLATGFAQFGVNQGFSVGLSGIENATGGTGTDRLAGDDLANVLNGGDGNDAIGGGLGNDTLIGGAGTDFVQYDSAANITVSLSITTAQNTGEGLDVLSGFENLQSGGGNDSLTGNAGANIFFSLGGNDTILGLAGDDEINAGEGDDVLIGGLGADVLRGDGGSDTASYATSAAAVSIVHNGFFTYVATLGDAAGDSFGSIENFIGSRFADTLTGDDTDNVIEGGAGADSLTGGGGTDTASYAGSTVAVRASLVAGVLGVGGDAAGDRLFAFENLRGSAFNDTLIGDAGANRLTGGAGINVLEGGAGADTLDGTGSANDTASYAAALDNLTVNLLLATQSGGGDADGDVLIGIENLIGGAGGDFLTGDAGNNRIDGGAGDDVIEGGVGNDTLIGGANGSDGDTVRYSNATSGVTVSLAITVAQNTGTSTGTDVISGFENLNGSTHADRLTGNASANFLFASDGDDTVNGGLGNDVLFGGSGADHFVFNTTLGATNVDTLVSFQVGVDKIELENAIFTALGLVTGALSNAQFALTTDSLTTTDRIIYNEGTGALFYDRDGSGTAVAVQFANVLGGGSAGVGAVGLSASDFLIV